MERCPTQAVLPLVGLAAEKVIRDGYHCRGKVECELSSVYYGWWRCWFCWIPQGGSSQGAAWAR
ncbi:MAG: hypothetical protein ACQESR_09795 [Planctomycetota bacterium]